MSRPENITKAQVVAAAEALGLDPNCITELHINPSEVAVTYLDIHESKRGTTQGPVVYATHRYPIAKEPRA